MKRFKLIKMIKVSILLMFSFFTSSLIWKNKEVELLFSFAFYIANNRGREREGGKERRRKEKRKEEGRKERKRRKKERKT